jgi:transposase
MGRRVRFSKEFKLEAVRLLELGQKSAVQLALELGVRRNQLYKWKEQLGSKGEKAFRGPGRKPVAEESEVSRLKRELEKVTEERDILKKAAAYFARELP